MTYPAHQYLPSGIPGGNREVEEDALQILMHYDYPGNVRNFAPSSSRRATSHSTGHLPCDSSRSTCGGRNRPGGKPPSRREDRSSPWPRRSGATSSGLMRKRPITNSGLKIPRDRSQYPATEARLLRGGSIPSMQGRPAFPRKACPGHVRRDFRASFLRGVPHAGNRLVNPCRSIPCPGRFSSCCSSRTIP